MASPVNPQRIRTITEFPHRGGSVVYWMSRDQRVQDNWALLFAQSLAIKYSMPLAVVFVLLPEYLEATERQYGFMLKGLKETERALLAQSIPMFLLPGSPEKEIPNFIRKNAVTKLVSDFTPLNVNRQWKESVAQNIDCSFYVVDAHNIIPAWIVSDKREFGAYTIRPKVHRLLPEFLDEFPPVRKHPVEWIGSSAPIDWEKAHARLKINRHVTEVDWINPGEKSGQSALRKFISSVLGTYDANRNDPTLDGQSNLSPFLHFGHLAPQRVALDVVQSTGKEIRKIVQKKKNGSSGAEGNAEAFLEELIVRRELSDNFTLHNTLYESFDGFPDWAKKSLNEHRSDKREYLYTLEQFEQGATHDPLWNAAQMQMVNLGKMHGYMRMYWAKKILEWTPSPDEAMVIAIYLNDKYSLDGRDPNGYTGIAWSIGGVHDRAWFERPVYGKIRYMNANGCAKKFNVQEYIRMQNSA